MKLENDVKLDFQDVMFRPKRSTLSSRNEVVLEREITFNNGYRWYGVPIISSNMDTIGTFEMYKALSKHKIITCFNKHYSVEDFQNFLAEQRAKTDNPSFMLDERYFMLSSGISKKDSERLEELIRMLRPRFVCIDVANGYMEAFVEFVKEFAKTHPEIIIACGNVVTREIAEELIIHCKAHIVKVGIGSGSCCTTRLKTGVGLPQLSAVIECADACHGVDGFIISDGGCVHPADVSKAFGAGADFVMLGSMLAGHDQCAGEIIQEGEKKFKLFYGMSSETAQNKHHGGVAHYRSAEGRTVKVVYKGDVNDTILDILGGIRSTCTYIGARRIKDISKCTTFMRVNHQINTVYI